MTTEEVFREIITQLYNSFDTDGNGWLEKEPLKLFADKMHQHNENDEEAKFEEEKFDKAFATLDTEGDGKIRFEALYAMLLAFAKKEGKIAE